MPKLNLASSQRVKVRVLEYTADEVLALANNPTTLALITIGVNDDRRQKVALVDFRADLSEKLEVCQKALAEFLEEKRGLLPRFYFIGDDDLLEILGQSKNPEVIQAHLKKLFAGIFTVGFSQARFPPRPAALPPVCQPANPPACQPASLPACQPASPPACQPVSLPAARFAVFPAAPRTVALLPIACCSGSAAPHNAPRLPPPARPYAPARAFLLRRIPIAPHPVSRISLGCAAHPCRTKARSWL